MIEITKVSSRGQVVIPQSLRKDFNEGDKLIVIRNDKQIILKKVEDFADNIEEDLEFAKRTEEAHKRIETGEFVSIDSENLDEMLKW
ncbi:AbrB/MazE/SpoVT family DNA-binding domain-containing protein [archaeon]|jgi:AbrB family looped-hinge helix DNA binding protein|nr:AbrB/MazE/SpoVT family DNA-binding domain-containing protein [archaeon]MBT4373240.1 AbrB/MazE/SpoVT family DNA-binding domain-containing protein [archaeon]MBT4531585.1 AbrB/MazE/SpoVT family DNA-binding domain-containing protein [archaeon]MBT7001237.1 AbrB/MazE/SpoVT family DNA-binding domain-containing protein [archaeon]MBT7282277.1 AbrB/MazE/SpoVT family DNA-binding domain-containing protein [archaeon]